MSLRTVVTLAVVATALGFAPSSRRASRSSLTMVLSYIYYINVKVYVETLLLGIKY